MLKKILNNFVEENFISWIMNFKLLTFKAKFRFWMEKHFSYSWSMAEWQGGQGELGVQIRWKEVGWILEHMTGPTHGQAAWGTRLSHVACLVCEDARNTQDHGVHGKPGARLACDKASQSLACRQPPYCPCPTH